MNNNEAPPNQTIVQFCIPAEPADLDRLADLLREFCRLEHEVLDWRVTDGELR